MIPFFNCDSQLIPQLEGIGTWWCNYLSKSSLDASNSFHALSIESLSAFTETDFTFQGEVKLLCHHSSCPETSISWREQVSCEKAAAILSYRILILKFGGAVVDEMSHFLRSESAAIVLKDKLTRRHAQQ